MSAPRLQPPAWLAEVELDGYIGGMNWLTKSEQMVLTLILGLLLVGWGVKAWRTAHPPTVAVQSVIP